MCGKCLECAVEVLYFDDLVVNVPADLPDPVGCVPFEFGYPLQWDPPASHFKNVNLIVYKVALFSVKVYLGFYKSLYIHISTPLIRV